MGEVVLKSLVRRREGGSVESRAYWEGRSHGRWARGWQGCGSQSRKQDDTGTKE